MGSHSSIPTSHEVGMEEREGAHSPWTFPLTF